MFYFIANIFITEIKPGFYKYNYNKHSYYKY
jgi:hypothetical protein